MKMRTLNRFLLLLSLLVLGYLSSCSGSGTTASDDASSSSSSTTAFSPVTLGGAVGGQDVKLNLSTSDSGTARSATEVNISGFLVYDDMTLYCSGVFDPTSGDFVVSASGSFMDIKLVFTLTGIIVDGQVTSASIMLTVYESGVIIGSYGADLGTETEAVQKTSNECIDTSQDFGFEGRWKEAYTEDGQSYYTVLTITDTAYTIYDSYDNESWGGNLLHAEKMAGVDEWVIIPTDNYNYFIDLSISGSYEIYGVYAVKLRLSADGGSLIIGESYNEYYLTDLDLNDAVAGTVTSHGGYAYEQYSSPGGVDPFSTVSLDDIVNEAKAVDIDTQLNDGEASTLQKY